MIGPAIMVGPQLMMAVAWDRVLKERFWNASDDDWAGDYGWATANDGGGLGPGAQREILEQRW